MKLLKGLFIGVSFSQNDLADDISNFKINSCNAADKRPELSYGIRREYFEQNTILAQEISNYQLIDDYFTRSINASALAVNTENSDDISLTYNVIIQEGDSFGEIILSERSIQLSCKYARLINTNHEIQSSIETTDEITAIGDLSYSMIVTPGVEDAMTKIRIIDNHGIQGIYPRLLQCSVSLGEKIIWPIHNFRNESLCLDSRLGVQMLEMNENDQIAFEMRPFRFRNANQNQQQQIQCSLKLENQKTTNQGSICTCFNDAECNDECSNGDHNCDTNALCYNTDDGFNCVCKDGFIGDGIQCGDVDECISHENECHENASCENTYGGYTCTCLSGFIGDGITCDDIDECAGENECHYLATCTNELGGYTCTCYEHTIGDGFTCQGTCATGMTQEHITRDIYNPSTDLAWGRIGICPTGSSNSEGYLMIRFNDEWGTVCNDGFGEMEALSACRTLGFTSAVSGSVGYGHPAWITSYWNLPIWIDESACLETWHPNAMWNFLDCKRNPVGEHDCGHNEDVFLKCI